MPLNTRQTEICIGCVRQIPDHLSDRLGRTWSNVTSKYITFDHHRSNKQTSHG